LLKKFNKPDNFGIFKAMKKLLLLLSVVACIAHGQTATNFTSNDCAGNPHTLFNDLDGGKVVVLSWVMPCANCIGPVLSAQTEVQNFSSSNPGKILYYIADDFGTTNCTTLNSWCSTNGITPDAVFKNSAINMTDYGSTGMPKTIIIAGPNHTVFFNENNNVTVSNFHSAMINALAAAVGVKEQTKDVFKTRVSPNPANTLVNVTFQLNDIKEVTMDIYNTLGQNVRTANVKGVPGENTITIRTDDLANGTYILKINDTGSTKIIVSH
jgi:hypothetical protein